MMQYNRPKMATLKTLKRTLTMDLDRYIDICLIDEYANKDFEDGYSLDVELIPEKERTDFLAKLMEEDTSVRDFVLFQMQKMINERLPKCEAADRYEADIHLVQRFNGDIYLEGAY